jgi:hypothetical protein
VSAAKAVLPSALAVEGKEDSSISRRTESSDSVTSCVENVVSSISRTIVPLSLGSVDVALTTCAPAPQPTGERPRSDHPSALCKTILLSHSSRTSQSGPGSRS